MDIIAICPDCGRKIEVYVDTSTGVPAEAGAECQCGVITTFRVKWEPKIWLGNIVRIERLAVRNGEHEERPDEQLAST